MAPLEWTSPANLAQAVAALGPGALVKAGGVDVMDRCKERLEEPARIVNLRGIAGLDGVRQVTGAVEIDTLVTLARVAEDPVVRGRFPALAEAAGRAATPNVRNLATIGGNVLQRPRCWYFRQAAFPCLRKGGAVCFAQEGRSVYHGIFENGMCAAVHPSDTATALVAYGARARIVWAGGASREVPVEELFVRCGEDVRREHKLGRDEILAAFVIPSPPPGASSAYLRHAERESSDWPLATVAAVLDRDGRTCRGARIVLGAAAILPWRARTAEAVLTGNALDEGTIREAAEAAVHGATPLAENGYKVQLLEVLVRRAIAKAAGIG